jgi:DNA-binding MarR family transcriptional regulator
MLCPVRVTTDLAAELEDRIGALWMCLMREVPGGLSRTAGSVLALLVREGPQRVTALAAREHVAQPSMSVLAQRLEKRGLVQRTEDPDDRRACRVAITDAGRDLLRQRAEQRTGWLQARLDRLSPGERDAIRTALRHLDTLLEPDPEEDAGAR